MFIFSSLLFFEFFLEKAGSGKISKESLFPLLSTFCLKCDRNNSWSQYLNAIQLKMFNFNFSIWIFYPLKITNTFFDNVSFLLMHDWFDQTRIVIRLLYVPHIFVNQTNRQNPFGHSITSNFKISQVILAYSNVNGSFSTFKLKRNQYHICYSHHQQKCIYKFIFFPNPSVRKYLLNFSLYLTIPKTKRWPGLIWTLQIYTHTYSCLWF